MFKFKMSIFFSIFQLIKIWFYANIRHLSIRFTFPSSSSQICREIIQIHPNFKLLRLIMTQLNFWLNFGNRTGILRPLARLSFHPSSAIEQRSRTENLCRGRAEWFTVAKRKTANEAGLRTGNNLMRIPGTLASDSIRLSSNL